MHQKRNLHILPWSLCRRLSTSKVANSATVLRHIRSYSLQNRNLQHRISTADWHWRRVDCDSYQSTRSCASAGTVSIVTLQRKVVCSVMIRQSEGDESGITSVGCRLYPASQPLYNVRPFRGSRYPKICWYVPDCRTLSTHTFSKTSNRQMKAFSDTRAITNQFT